MLHILNGDAVVPTFKESLLTGDYAVWRELHCQGPTCPQIDSDSFQNIRTKFLKDFLDIPYHFYEKNSNSELSKIKNSSSTDFTLWFEYDLFCQINMMVAINLIRQTHSTASIYLINVGKTLDHNEWITLGQLSADNWKSEFKSKKKLDAEAILFMENAWNIYCSDNHREFENLMQNCPAVFKYLPTAIENHYRRFPSKKDGLTDIQRYVFKKLSADNYTPINRFLSAIMADFHFYGYGDLQYKAILKSLSHFVKEVDEQGLILKKRFTGHLTSEELDALPEMIYGGHSIKKSFQEDFIDW